MSKASIRVIELIDNGYVVQPEGVLVNSVIGDLSFFGFDGRRTIVITPI